MSPFTEEVVHRHQPGRGCNTPRGRGNQLGEVQLPSAARVWSDLQQRLDVLQADLQGLQASPRICQHSQRGGEGLKLSFIEAKDAPP